MTTTPTSPLEALEALQSQALSAIQNGQAATLDAVRKWNEGVAQFSAGLPTPAVPEVPADVKAALGEPKEIVDSVYDFAAKLLDLNKSFVHQLLEASNPEK